MICCPFCSTCPDKLRAVNGTAFFCECGEMVVQTGEVPPVWRLFIPGNVGSLILYRQGDDVWLNRFPVLDGEVARIVGSDSVPADRVVDAAMEGVLASQVLHS